MSSVNVTGIFKKPFVKIVLLALLIVLIFGLNWWRNNAYNGPLIHTAKVEEQDMGQRIYASGNVELQKKQEAPAFAHRTIKEILVKTGDQVKAGQLLAVIDCLAEERALADAKASLASAEADYEKMINPTPEDVQIGEADFTRMKIAYDNQLSDYQRQEALYAAGVISAQEMEAARQALSVQEADFLKAQKEYDILRNGPRNAELKVVEAQLLRAQAAVQAAEAELSRYVIKADFDGVVLSRNGQPGETAEEAEMILVIGQPENLQVKVGINEADSALIETGQAVVIEATALPGISFNGKVVEVAGVAEVNASSNSRQIEVPVLISVEDKSGRLKAGYSVDLEIITVAEKKRLVIPYEALQKVEDKQQVWICDQDTARLRSVTTGLEGELTVEVLEGLEVGDLIITDPPPQLEDGQKVRQAPLPAATEEGGNHD